MPLASTTRLRLAALLLGSLCLAAESTAGPTRVFVRGPVDPVEARRLGISVGARAAGWTTLRVPGATAAEAEAALRSLRELGPIVPSSHCRLYLDSTAVDTGVSLFRSLGSGGFNGPIGEGVVIGIVDTGIDLAHADFRREDGTTRVAALWDQASTAGTIPEGFGYGSEWDAAAIDLGLAVSTDESGHGTHVAGIAAGNGRGGTAGLDAGRYVGVAPGATLCVVKLDFSHPAGAPASDVADAIAYVFAKADAWGMPAVVNLSLGSHEGPHDGTFPFDEMVEAMTGPGRIVVAAAGNEGAARIHARSDVAPSGTAEWTLALPGYTPNVGGSNDYVRLSMWHEGADAYEATVITPGGVSCGPVTGPATFSTPSGRVTFCFGSCTTPGVATPEILVALSDSSGSAAPATGVWRLLLTRLLSGGPGRVDGYVSEQILGAGSPLAVWQQGGVPDGTIASPASGDSVIAVGAHVTKPCWVTETQGTICAGSAGSTGQIAFFSSRGPRRDGVLKPDLTAPGMVIASTRSAAAAYDPLDVVPGGAHVVMLGTSMATPVVAGAAALVLARPGWGQSGPARVRDHLRATARVDGFTGAVPNTTWGWGKLNVLAAMSMTPTAVAAPGAAGSPPKLSISRATPNPFSSRVRARLIVPTAGATLHIVAANGALVKTLRWGLAPGVHSVEWDGRDEEGARVASGIYFFLADFMGQVSSAKVLFLRD